MRTAWNHWKCVVFAGTWLAFTGGVAHCAEEVLEFTGTDSYVDLGMPDALQFASDAPLTVEGWVYLNSVDDRDMLYCKNYGRNTSGYTHLFGFYINGRIAAYTGSAWREPNPTVTVDTERWVHVAFSFDGTTMTYYLDGESVGASVFNYNNVENNTVKIGGYHSGSDVNGMKSEVRVWDHARSAAEIQQNMNRRLTGTQPGLLGCWPLNEGSGSLVLDQTANAITGTVVHAAWTTTEDLTLANFTVAHPVTGSERFTNTNEVDVVLFPEFEGYTHYQVTEDGAAPEDVPAAWTSTNTLPETIAFTTPVTDTNVVLTAWFTNVNDTVPLQSSVAEIIYTKAEPVASALGSLTRPIVAGYTTVTLTGSDLDDGSSGGTALGEAIGIAGYTVSCPEDVTPGDSAKVTLVDVGVFDVAFTVINEAGNTSSTVTTEVSVVEGETLIWTGQGADALASTAANWNPPEAPGIGSQVVFDDAHYGNAQTNVTWDLDVVLQSWTQTTNYSGTVTIQTRYSGQGSFTNLVIADDVTLEGGIWTHPANSGVDTATDLLSVSVGGDFTLGSNAVVDVVGRGFDQLKGPAPANGTQRSAAGRGASHGGLGAYQPDYVDKAPTYGSAVNPATLGSGGHYGSRGGGLARIHAGGNLTLNGEILADASYGRDLNPGGSGGSINLRGATVSGSGRLSAGGARGYQSGGGGRIALVLTNGTDFAGVRFEAFGAEHKGLNGAAGTIYREAGTGGSPSIREVWVDNGATPTWEHVFTEMPFSYESYDPPAAVGWELDETTLVVTNLGRAGLSESARIGDIAWIDSNSALHLEGRTLYVKANEPPNPFPADYGNGTIVSNGGRILWGNQSVTFLVAATNGPNGTVAMDPDIPGGYYDYGSQVVLTAIPDTGNDFVFWKGAFPETLNREDNPLTAPVYQAMDFFAVFASSDPETRTWIGDGADTLASTAGNWYPAMTPVDGDRIVFDAGCVKECHWDLDIQPASWTQHEGYSAAYSVLEGYRGWVWMMTRYPGQGAFSNLNVTGDIVLHDGTWSHPENSGDDTAIERLSVRAGGDFTLGDKAMIDVVGRGFDYQRGPGAGNSAQRSVSVGLGAAHGGMGAFGTNTPPADTYGSILVPGMHGSGGATSAGGRSRGGGTVMVYADGNMTIDGDILADARYIRNLEPGGAGGSVWLRGATLRGAGLLSARGVVGYQCGGGGRIALHRASGMDFDALRFDLRGAMHSSGGFNFNSAAGTLYLGGTAFGRPAGELIVDNGDITTAAGVFTPLLPVLAEDAAGAFADVTVRLRGASHLALATPNLRIRDLTVDTDATLYLKGHDLYVRSPEPRDGLDGTVVEEGGRILWARPGTILLLR